MSNPIFPSLAEDQVLSSATSKRRTTRRLKYSGTCECGAACTAGAETYYENQSIVGCPSCCDELEAFVEEEILTLRIKRIKYQDKAGQYVVAHTCFDDPGDAKEARVKNPTIVGRLGATLKPDDVVEVQGHYEHHARYGWQFFVKATHHVLGSSVAGLRNFLTSLPHIGPRRAIKIMQLANNRRSRVLRMIQENPEQLTEIDGITIERALEVKSAIEAAGPLKKAMIFVSALQLRPGIAKMALDNWGQLTPEVLTADPYSLLCLEGVGFQEIDATICAVFRVEPTDPRRVVAALNELMRHEEREGHTFALVSDLLDER